MRSLMLGDCAHYVSPYMRGVRQAMELLGHRHHEVSVRASLRTIEQRIRLWRPEVIWTHMVLWPPQGAPPVADLIGVLEMAKREFGSQVVLHDGDAKKPTRYPHDLGSWCALALVNHAYHRDEWNVPVIHWPYFALVQQAIARPLELLRCDVFFAGTLGGGIYAERTALVNALREHKINVLAPMPGENTFDRTAEIAASAGAVLGFGRSDVSGWVDTRVFQYPGAGGILLHDDVQGHLEPWVHYVPYWSGEVKSVLEALAQLRAMSEGERMALRARAFAFVQQYHSSVARVRKVLDRLGVQ